MDKYYPNSYERMPPNNMPSNTKINNTFMPPPEEMDSRNEIFSKTCTDPSFKDRKPLNNLQAQMAKSNPPATLATKSKNMHTKINRGISPNQPPQNKMKSYGDQDMKKSYQPSNIGKHESKESTDASRRSSSLKVKKENDKMMYHKPSPSTRGNNRGGSFVVPSNSSSTRKNEIGGKKSSKGYNSSQNMKSNYSKTSTAGISSHLNNSTSGSGHYRLGSNYGGGQLSKSTESMSMKQGAKPYNVRQPGGSNFTANPRIRKPVGVNSTAQNTMASFRSGPVRVVNDGGSKNNIPQNNVSNNGSN